MYDINTALLWEPGSCSSSPYDEEDWLFVASPYDEEDWLFVASPLDEEDWLFVASPLDEENWLFVAVHQMKKTGCL